MCPFTCVSPATSEFHNFGRDFASTGFLYCMVGSLDQASRVLFGPCMDFRKAWDLRRTFREAIGEVELIAAPSASGALLLPGVGMLRVIEHITDSTPHDDYGLIVHQECAAH